VAGGIKVLSCSSVRPRVRPETLLTRYIAQYLIHFHQTYINDALRDGDESIIEFGVKRLKVKVCWYEQSMLETALYGLVKC